MESEYLAAINDAELCTNLWQDLFLAKSKFHRHK